MEDIVLADVSMCGRTFAQAICVEEVCFNMFNVNGI